MLLTRSLKQVSADAGALWAVFGALAFAPVSRAVLEAALPDTDLRRPLNELVNYGMLLRQQTSQTSEVFKTSEVSCAFQVSHALIHTYSGECCPAPADVAARLAAYYTAFVEEQQKQGLAGYNLLDTERAHIMRVLETCRERELWQAISDLVGAVWLYLDIRGYWTEFQAAFEINLMAAQKQGDREGEGWCLGALGYNADNRGDYATALRYDEQSLAICCEIGDKAKEGVACGHIARIYQKQGDLAQAEQYISRAVQIEAEIGSPNLEKHRAVLEDIREQRRNDKD